MFHRIFRVGLSVFLSGILWSISLVHAETKEPPVFADNLPISDHPRILADCIIFNDGSILPISRKERRIFQDYNKAMDIGGVYAYSQKTIDIPSWKQILVLTEHSVFESGVIQTTRYDYMGNLISRRKYSEKVLVLEKSKRLVLLDDYSGYVEIFILDENDKLVATITDDNYLGYFFKAGVTEDEKLIWFFGRSMTKNKGLPHPIFDDILPSTMIIILDINGNTIKKFQSIKDEILTIKFEGKEYKFQTGEPQFPG